MWAIKYYLLVDNLAMRTFFVSMFVVLFSGCVSTSSNYNELSTVAKDYFNVYSQRIDFERLMSFYDENARFEDIIYGNNLEDKTAIRAFLAWDKGEFKVLSSERALTVTKQVFWQKMVVTEGYFHKFSYDGQELGPWLFVIIQEFNAQNKIIKQTDWINYTPREAFLGGVNMNDFLIKNKPNKPNKPDTSLKY